MLGEDGELVEDKDSPMAEDEFPVIVKRAVAPMLQEQQKKETTLEVAGHISEEGGMVKVEEQIISAIGATSGGTDRLNALKQNTLAREECLLHSLRKLRHHPKK